MEEPAAERARRGRQGRGNRRMEGDGEGKLKEEEGAGGIYAMRKAARGCAHARCPIGGTPNSAGPAPVIK